MKEIPSQASLFSFLQTSFKGRIRDDSRKVSPGDLFIALTGLKNNGHHFIEEALKRGASTLILEDKKWIPKNFPKNFKGGFFLVSDSRKILPQILNRYLDSPSQKMFCVGITGTNGKTSTALMTKKIFQDLGWKTGSIGTLGKSLADFFEESSLTTPSAIELHECFEKFLKRGAQALVMEASSIGLDQKRADGIYFNLAVFTNFTREHLDYHQDMETYFKAKKRLFEITRNSGEQNYKAILNGDDPYAASCVRLCRMPLMTYGQGPGVDLRWRILDQSLSKGLHLEFFYQNKNLKIKLPLIGDYNGSNAAAALACALSAGFSFEKSGQALESFRGVPGRLQRVPSKKDFFVFIDYAHTPSALETVLNNLKAVSKNKKIITVFGCGGGRDRGKRAPMAQAAAKLSDRIVVTSDNPRDEEPEAVIQDIAQGFKKENRPIFKITDRKEGIKKGLDLADSGDIVLIAGRGHEKFQILKNGRRSYFSDFETAKNELKG